MNSETGPAASAVGRSNRPGESPTVPNASVKLPPKIASKDWILQGSRGDSMFQGHRGRQMCTVLTCILCRAQHLAVMPARCSDPPPPACLLFSVSTTNTEFPSMAHPAGLANWGRQGHRARGRAVRSNDRPTALCVHADYCPDSGQHGIWLQGWRTAGHWRCCPAGCGRGAPHPPASTAGPQTLVCQRVPGLGARGAQLQDSFPCGVHLQGQVPRPVGDKPARPGRAGKQQ